MRGPFVQQRRNDEEETEKPRFLVVKKIRDAILDETFKPGDRLPESELAEMFKVSRSPIREALFALENEGTVTTEPYRGAIRSPSPQRRYRTPRNSGWPSLLWLPKRRTVIFLRRILTQLTGSQSKRPAAKAPKNTSSTTATFGTSYSRKPNGPFFGRCSGNWTTE